MKPLFYPVLIGLVLAGCSQAEQKESADQLPTTTTETLATAPQMPATIAAVATTSTPDRTVIYHGELNLAVDDFGQASTRIDQLLQEHHAYVGTAHETRANGQHRQEMTIKVPPGKFMSMVQALGKLGRVEDKDVASADVTADVLEASSSLSAKQDAETRYQQLLKQARTPAEIQRLEEQARQVRGEIATTQARLKDFGSQSAWATLTLRYFQEIPAEEITSPAPDAAPRFLTAFNRGWSIVLGVAVLLTNIWPLLLLSGVGFWLRRRWQLRQQATV